MNNAESWLEPTRDGDVWLVFYKITGVKRKKNGARFLRLPYVRNCISPVWDSNEDVAEVPNLSTALVAIAEQETVQNVGQVVITNIVRI